jgi:hypothetical protein
MNDGHLLLSMQNGAAELIDDLVTQTEVILNNHFFVVYLRYTMLDKIARADTKYEGKLQTPTPTPTCRCVKQIPPICGDFPVDLGGFEPAASSVRWIKMQGEKESRRL